MKKLENDPISFIKFVAVIGLIISPYHLVWNIETYSDDILFYTMTQASDSYPFMKYLTHKVTYDANIFTLIGGFLAA